MSEANDSAASMEAITAERQSGRNRWLVGTALVVVVVLGLGLYVMRSNEATYTISGALGLFDQETLTAGCSAGVGGYADIQAGTQVTVTDETNKILGVSSLEPGVRDTTFCRFPFVVSGLPRSKFYSVEVGHRGRSSGSFELLVSQGWKVELQLGDD